MNGRRKNLSAAEIESIVEMRERGLTYNQIAMKTGCSRGIVSWHCLRLGAEHPTKKCKSRDNYHLIMPAVKRGNHIVRAFTPDEDAVLQQMATSGARIVDMGRAIGRRGNSITGRLMTLARREERASQ